MAASETDLKKFLREHVKYEICMLRSTRSYLASREWDCTVQPDWTMKNALIEAFWVHARNLLEFFGMQRRAYPVTKFCTSSYKPMDFASVGNLYGKICAQITHLPRGRTDDDSAKLDLMDLEINNLLDKEIERFCSHLYDQHKDVMTADTKPPEQKVLQRPMWTSSPSVIASGWYFPRERH